MPKMIYICILLIYFKVISKKGGHYCPRLPYIFRYMQVFLRFQGSYNIPVTKFKAFSRPFQGLINFFKAKQNWKNSRFNTKCVSFKAYIYIGWRIM